MSLTVPEVATRLRCGEWSVRRLINAPGGLRASKVAGRWLIDPQDVDDYLEVKANRPRRRRKRAS